jgi:hypothetical protein
LLFSKTGILSGAYNIRDIEVACKKCICLLVKEFEGECKKISTTNEVAFILSFYSALNINKNRYSYIERVIYSKMCKYLFGELTKLHIKSGEIKIDENFISRLYAITKLISNFSQRLYQCYLDYVSYFQLEIYESYYEITTRSQDYASMQDRLKQIVESDALKGKGINNDSQLSDFFCCAQRCFGQVVTDFQDVIINTDDVIVDCNHLNFDNFVKLIDYNGVMPNNTVDLTTLFRKYPDNTFLDGLTLSSVNVDLLRSVHKPHDISKRSRFRPIIAINVDGVLRYISTPFMAFEAFSELIANQIPFGLIPNEWEKNPEIVEYTKIQKEKHDKLLEDPVEKIIRDKNFLCLRNKKSINNINLEKEKAINPEKNVGEIDFIIVDINKNKVYVCDCKYIKTKYDFASFCVDKNSFNKENGYDERLGYKLVWVKSHFNDVAKEMNLDFEISTYTFEGLFITYTFVYYGLSSPYPIIPLKWLSNYFDNGQRMQIC